MRVLLVESESEDALFFQDVLAEIESGRYWDKWVHIETLHAPTWSDAVAILGNETLDVILLDLDLADSQGIDTFRAAQAQAPEIPVILLVGPESGELAARMVRDGAQDFLIKKQVDCAPLAHAIRNAVERHRLLMAARAAATTDPLTGLLSRNGFLACADRDRKLAERLGRRLMVMVAEPKSLSEIASAYGEHRRDLALVEAADHLRTLVGPTDLLGRLGETRFGLAIFDTGLESVEEIWARIHSSAAGHRILIGAAIFDADRPASLEALLDQAILDLTPSALAMRR
jgi:PleD family two-component response regulator